MRTVKRAVVLAFFALWLWLGARSIVVVHRTWQSVNDRFCVAGTPTEVDSARRETGIDWIEVEHCQHEGPTP